MRPVWTIADAIVSPLGLSSHENYSRIRQHETGVKSVLNTAWHEHPVMVSAMDSVPEDNTVTRFEWICRQALQQALANLALPAEKTIFILSTTKGNIDLLEKDSGHPRLSLHATAQHLATGFGFTHHTVVSNACISGVLALIVAKRFLETGRYDHAVVVGADVLSRFVISGFKSLAAMSADYCRPFDKDRTGINLGEAAGVMVLSAVPGALHAAPVVRLLGGCVSNDANHISGPSRTGEELAQAIAQALEHSSLRAADIDFVSAHGTATVYNDEMEAKAFTLSGLNATPLNSLKGYYGHTLGAAGVIETIVSTQSLLHNEVIGTKGFETLGVSQPIHILRRHQQLSTTTMLKTASGFGGCNAALVLQKGV